MYEAQIAMVLAEINRDRKKRPKAFTLDDFMLKTEEKKVQTQEEQWRILRAFARQHNAAIGAK